MLGVFLCLLIGMYAVKCLGYKMYMLTQFRVGMERVNGGDVSFRGHLVIFFFLWLKNDEEASVEGRE